MNREQKTTTVDELKETLAKAQSLVIADYRGLKVSDTLGLRSEIRKAECHYRVVKNTLVKLAVKGTAMEGISPLFTGPTAIAYSFEDPVSPAKILDQFEEKLPALELKGGFLEGEVLDAAGVKRLAKMKGKDELRAELLAQFMAPAQSLVRLFNAVPTNVLYLLQAREREMGGP
ncbi:MAG: 50S ribosomal protein L10 [Proteobacteria bacterium]|nr:MAG: 50S ribosomal protein L10 [Pseudomonadota bacterium]PIE18476.1 MAG: 50S ribosomal protein L10 [Pseudomonadota bacterium]